MTVVSTGSLTLKDLNDAKQLSMYIGASQSRTVMFDGASGYTPNYTNNNQILTPQVRIAGGGVVTPSATRWYYQTNGTGTVTAITVSGTPTGHTLGASQPLTLTISTNILSANTSMTFICEADYTDSDTGFLVTAKSEIEIVKIENGGNAITAFTTNSSVTLPATTAGAVSVFTNSSTDIYVYDGTDALQFLTSGTAGNGQFTIATAISPASGVTLATPTATGTARTGATPYKATYGNITAFATANDTVGVTFTITGKTVIGTAFTTTVLQTFAKSKAGTDSTTYNLTSSAEVMQKNEAGTVSPATLTFTGFTTTGAGQPTSVANGYKFVIDKSISGGAFENNVASPTTGASINFTTNVANLSAVRCRMYRVGDTPSTTNWIDEKTIYVVADGQSSVYNLVWTPDGNAIQNSVGQLTVKSDLYDGSSIASSGVTYQWYLQNPLATTASLGDADGGNGWEKIISVADPATNATPTAPVTAGSTLPATTYYFKYTWISKTSESKGSATQQSQIVASGQGLNIQVPAFPSGVTGARVYVGNVTGDANLKFQGDISVSNGSLLIKTPLVTDTELVPTVANTAVSTNASLIVKAFAIAGMESFKCVATYATVKYTGVTTVQDLSDPILVVLEGVDTFKNGTGTTSITAKLFQDGGEIDTTGTLYTYTWGLYNASGGAITPAYSTLTGKTVTVDGRDVNARANLVCEISR
jgi:hypothetical protein